MHRMQYTVLLLIFYEFQGISPEFREIYGVEIRGKAGNGCEEKAVSCVDKIGLVRVLLFRLVVFDLVQK